jgi:hypothetical protein
VIPERKSREMELNGRTEDIHGNHTGYFYIEFPLRDLFAAFALAGLAARGTSLKAESVEIAVQGFGVAAYKLADAAIATREEGE